VGYKFLMIESGNCGLQVSYDKSLETVGYKFLMIESGNCGLQDSYDSVWKLWAKGFL